MTCKCRRRKRDFQCHEVRINGTKLDCDDICKSNKEKKQKVRLQYTCITVELSSLI